MNAFVKLALFGALLLAGCGEPTPHSVVIVTLDTTRVDHLPDYGYARDTTPNLSALSRESVRYTRAWSTSSWTLPAHASLFTGLYPASHGAHAVVKGDLTLEQATGDPMGAGVPVSALDPSQLTLAEQLAERGYHTGAFVGGPWLRRPFGLLQGFEHIDDDVGDLNGRRAEALTDAALAWLREIPTDAPYFLFVNYFDPHAPYDPPEGFDDLPRARDGFPLASVTNELLRGVRELSPAERQGIVDRYDGEIRYMDHHLGRLLDAVAARPDGEHALRIVTSDHGEAFGEGGRYFHTYWLSEEILRIPFWVRYPDRRGAGTSDATPVQLVDVLPLVADALQIALPSEVEGRAPGARERAFAQVYPQRFGALVAPGRLGRGREAVIEWPYKLVHVNRGDRQLVRVDRSPEEPTEDPRQVKRLARALQEARRARRVPKTTAPTLDEETRRMLQNLGYVE